MLTDLIARYFAAQRAWLVLFDQEDPNAGSSPEWDAYELAENAVLYFPCKTLDEVWEKAAFVLSDPNAFDTVRNCIHTVGDDNSYVLAPFLRSLLGEADADGMKANADAS
ncbi:MULTISPECIES: hypothetical protein [unclassified Rhizobium]|uniref:hypothetical protein n=1 Tax=unclassified Rhizobium TaxID=2613769 RepID=UPI00115F5440|nr:MULTISPECIES: hypothetical protein [unclassified Rhizobium]TQX88463.1 hypothetical protein EQW76_11550 [Rhizobium sp. rho-13.1]TQY12658.1 hypothetical protein EQW74_15195 [Rhizobium sp. rho-1.1]